MAENNKNQKRLNGRKEFNRLTGHEENKRLPQHEQEKRLAAHVEDREAAAMAAVKSGKSSGMGAMGWAALAVLALVVAAIVAMFFTDGRMLIDNSKSNRAIATARNARSVDMAGADATAATVPVTYYDAGEYAAEVTPGRTIAAYTDGNVEEAVGVRHKVVVQPVHRKVVKRVIVIPAELVENDYAYGAAMMPGQEVVYYFDFDDATIPESAVLNNVAAAARATGRTVGIDAYTDPSGSAAYNSNLSQRRANAIGRYLVAHGVSPDHIKARGMGATDAYATPRQDRRAEITLE